MKPNLLKNLDGLSPLIGTVLVLAITFLLAGVIATSLFGGEHEDDLAPAPAASFSVAEYNNTSLKVVHSGGESINFDNSTTSVILNVDGKDGKNYFLNSSSLGSLGAGETKMLPLKDREGNLIPKKAGDVATLKFIDLKTQKPIFTQEIKFIYGSESVTQESESAVEYLPGIIGHYYLGKSFSGTAENRTDSRLRFAENASHLDSKYGSDIVNWPKSILNTTDNFSVVYEGLIKIEQKSNYTFYLTSDDWAQLYINGSPVISESYTKHNKTTNNATISLPAGYHPIRVEMKEYTGTSILHLNWSSESFSSDFVKNFYH
jgi:flagellin-like protein